MLSNLTEIKDKEEWIKTEIDKFAERGQLSYKIRNQLAAIIKEVEGAEYELKFCKEEGISTKKLEQVEKDLKYCKEEILPLAKRLYQYRAFQESQIHDLMREVSNPYNPNDNLYYRFRKLVNMVNAYWDITGEKPANRIAWGWSQCRSKDNPQAYLYGCIRGYLKRNGKFDKKEFNGIWFGSSL